jgi:UTP--glucose-1-phosphate uridylyltransferase
LVHVIAVLEPNMVQKVRKAIFPVGGMGTRFLPATKAMPKEMLPIVDKPLIQYAVEEARAAGIEEIIFVTGRGKAAIENHFDRVEELEASLRAKGDTKALDLLDGFVGKPGEISYVRQQQPLGLGHAVWCARNLIGDEPFAILLADDFIHADVPCLKQMVDAYEQVGGCMVAVMDVPPNQTHRYGIIQPGDSNGRLVDTKAVVEKPAAGTAPSNMAVIGRYILTPDVFAVLDKATKGAGGEIQLTDAMAQSIGKMPFNGFRFDGVRYDCGDKLGFLCATVAMALARSELAAEFDAFLRQTISKNG